METRVEDRSLSPGQMQTGSFPGNLGPRPREPYDDDRGECNRLIRNCCKARGVPADESGSSGPGFAAARGTDQHVKTSFQMMQRFPCVQENAGLTQTLRSSDEQ